MINVEQHLGLVDFVIKKYFINKTKIRNYDLEDVYQIGYIGLIKAANDFDTKYNVKFSTYAVKKIWGEITRSFREDKWYIGSREQRATGEAKEPLSLNKPIKTNDDDKITLLDLQEGENTIEELEEKLFIEELLSKLDKTERIVIEELFFNEKFQRELIEKLNLSQATISKKKLLGLKKMRQAAPPSELVC